ncbi:membrane protein insertase YidC [Reichenbachiella carrageenanivorans]|uniref:Membrane protein insertase YidC n=1 Tax=Reichenbachiella carrageenanivorans TaxID=2979869 RepID=A0ABY6CXT4_9BACT|nr:membrane protein insertase YidC [Reichenbachiella carrageenanivorans]UXX78534.1 membrane protein insertase YidC [Reichenbachiella carrageenanivorans]
MDRNQITGLVLMLALMTIYFQFFAPEVPEQPVEQATIETTTPAAIREAEISTPVATGVDDSLTSAIYKERYGIFAPFASGEEKEVEIENESVKIILSSKGGVVKRVELKDYLTYEKDPLILIDRNSSTSDLLLMSNYKAINVSELYYHTQHSKLEVSGTDSLSVSFRVALDGGRYLEHKYKLGGTGFQLKYEINLVGMDGVIDNQDAQLTWVDHMKNVEHTLKESRAKTTINYQPIGGDFDDLGISEDAETENIEQGLKWFAFKQRFFAAALIAENKISKATLSTYVDTSDSTTVKSGTAVLTLPIGDLKTGKGQFQYYFGPNDYTIQKKVVDGFEQNVELGWFVFRLVNKWLIIPIFNLLEKFISNYGVIIIILVFVIRLILAPLTYKSHMSMAKMKVLKPEMDAIKEKHDGDMQKSQQETMELYRKAGINPLSGCIPVLLQFPFLLAMFNFFPNSIELRQQPFLWATDLSTYDNVMNLPFTIPFYGDHVSMFCLLMTASTLLYTWSNSQMNTQMQGPMKSMQYMMPIMFLFFLNEFSAGLTFYYFVSNIVSFGQMALFRKFVDEDKILKVMEENRKKNANKSKSKFQLKLEEAMKAGEVQRKQGKKKK